MVAQSYLSAAEAASINQERRNALATRIVLQEPQVSIVLYRYNVGTAQHDARPAQLVLFRYDKTQLRSEQSQGAAAQHATGTMKRELPFDVRIGDTFELTSGQVGRVTVVQKPNGGIQRVRWSTDEGVPA